MPEPSQTPGVRGSESPKVRTDSDGLKPFTNYPVRTVGDLRRALDSFTDDADLLLPVTIYFHLDLVHGSRIELDTQEVR